MAARQISTSGFRYVCGFVINNALTVFASADGGFVEGLSDSLWAEPKCWFPWLLRFICYATLLHHFGLTQWMRRKVLEISSRIWACAKREKKTGVRSPPQTGFYCPGQSYPSN